jgi:Family of unknown function (DUF5681)
VTDQRRLANLKPFPKGTSGNPGGRPKGLSITAAVRRELQESAPLLLARKVLGTDGAEGYDAEPVTKADLVAARVVALAMDGDLDAIKLVWAYVDGKPAQAVDVSGRVEHNLTIEAVRRAIGLAR